MKKVILLLMLSLIFSGCASQAPTKETYDFKVVPVSGYRVNIAELVEYMGEDDTVHSFTERIYNANRNSLVDLGLIDRDLVFKDGVKKVLIVPVKKKK